MPTYQVKFTGNPNGTTTVIVDAEDEADARNKAIAEVRRLFPQSATEVADND